MSAICIFLSRVILTNERHLCSFFFFCDSQLRKNNVNYKAIINELYCFSELFTFLLAISFFPCL